VRSLVRDPSRLAPSPNQTAVRFILDEFDGFERALSGAEVLALITPTDPRQVEREAALIAAAECAGIKRIIKVSVIGADLVSPISPFARWSGEIERALAASRVPHVVLRANFYMQNLLRQRQSIESGLYTEPLGDIRVALLDVGDMAAVAVAVAGGRFDGRALVLTGGEPLSGEEIAAKLASAMGHAVRFVSPDLESFKATLLGRGVPGWRVAAQVELYGAVLSGRAPHLAAVSPDVAVVTGRAPRTLEQFARLGFAG
jgi:uncharacterized protein YbjT (DUF2867 family)